MGSVLRGGWSRLDRWAPGVGLVAVFVTVGCATGAPHQPEPGSYRRTADRMSTVASAAIDTTDWQNQHADRVEDLIAGRFAGVEVIPLARGGSALRIRGVNTILGNTEPLYIIDGVPVDAPPGVALMGLNPADVATIQVLKDAGATALYGIRGANGVIVITTKRAR